MELSPQLAGDSSSSLDDINGQVNTINPLGSGPGYVNLFFLSPNRPNTPTTTRRPADDVPTLFLLHTPVRSVPPKSTYSYDDPPLNPNLI